MYEKLSIGVYIKVKVFTYFPFRQELITYFLEKKIKIREEAEEEEEEKEEETITIEI